MNSSQLTPDEYAPYYSMYISTLDHVNLVEDLEISLHKFIRFVQEIPIDKHGYRYAEGKWTIKDIVQHLIDAERIFSYRALRFARNDKTELPGFSEDAFAAVANAESRTLMDLLTEYSAVRHSTLLLFKSFDDLVMMRKGTASDNVMSVRAVGFVIIGHQNHHQRIFEERYLDAL